MEYKNLTSFQLDALKEVTNIGAGNSATSLSMLLGTKIDMSVPSVNLIEFEELLNSNKENEVVAVLVKVFDDIPGSILYVFEKDIALKMISKMISKDEAALTEMGISVISEIGNIIASSFMNSIVAFTNLKATVSVPAVANDMLSAILVTTFVETGQYQEYVLDIETLFIGSGEDKLEGHFYFVPAPGSLEKILEALGIK
ncbi:chemotaxis protein CheC [Caproiciproducens sp. MSJ-32]|uniref:chemotaxis protein CheC n=1 Tax=Caproiciproducens sp. MSJ-32 TaxID=2841527 RepID=UPI001C0F785D|nr:chemotaxis protein CheC [Caproiciproducens sp. MSJ-32]MBU5454625.1 chemotaxis protein CheC [Caproiciproducens sp. MSJ-32]